jgi:hypothetical protein
MIPDAPAHILPGLALLAVLVILALLWGAVRAIRRTVPPQVPPSTARPACPPSPVLPYLARSVPVDDDAPIWRPSRTNNPNEVQL